MTGQPDQASNERQAPLVGKSTRERNDYEVAQAAVRMIRALGARVASDDPTSLVLLDDIRGALEVAWAVSVAGFRDSGFSDDEIGKALGVSKQAVQQRWPRQPQHGPAR